MQKANKSQIVIYQAKSGAIELRGDLDRQTIWATQAEIAKIFAVNSQAITKHIKNIYKEKELEQKSTCSKMEQVQIEGKRSVKRTLDIYNLDILIAVGYRVNSVLGTKFRQWATKTLREHITKGYTINPHRIKTNYDEFKQAVENIKQLLPKEVKIDQDNILELISAFAETWLSLDAYDKDTLVESGVTKRKVNLTAKALEKAIVQFKNTLMLKGEVTDLFARERLADSLAGIVGNVMQSFDGQSLYPSIEEKAAHLLYFIVKNHPFIDGNKRSGAYAFIWFLQKAGILNKAKITSAALTAITLLIAESDPKNKDRMVKLVLQLLKIN